jgi:peptidyl-prolyl cis-trans isomerase SurA
MSAKDSNLKYLIQEYHDGLLLYEISNRMVWDKAAKDEEGLAAYFKKNKKKYKWDSPRFKGIAYHVKEQADVKAVKDCVKDKPFTDWATVLRKTFNNDSVIRIRVEKGIFKKGDNALIDKEVFKKDTTVKALKSYPIDATYGKILKDGPEDYQDVRAQVVADYQEFIEKGWVEALRDKYKFTVDKNILATVNKH